MLGRVRSFDAARGRGELEATDGARYGFHATAIGDGTRRIEVGAAVAATLGPGHGGHYEARSVVALVDPSPPA